ncbi:MAG TPA: DUF4112 domain-containing protein [Tepidisphaeraceae bacterium]|jgi:hypothetical protein
MSAINAQQLVTPFRWAKNKLTKTDLETDLRRARTLAKLLDTQFKVGGVRFGLEAVIGLVPVAGDTIGALAGLYPLWIANRHKLGKGVQARMAANLAIEFGGGLLPWVGDFFDVAFKANIRNVKLLEKAAEAAPQATGE